MNQFELRCEGKEGCSSPVAIACNCGMPVVNLCVGCISNHVFGPGDHRLLRLSQAQKLLRSSISPVHFEESNIKYLRFKSDILNYIQSLKDFKVKVASFKLEILDHIEKTIDSKFDQIDSIIDRTCVQLYDLNQKPDRQILQSYEENGLETVIQNYVYNMTLNVYNVKEAIDGMIIIDTRDSSIVQESNHDNIPIQVQELKDILQDQAKRYEELESRLNKLQESSLRDLQDKSQEFKESISGLQDRTGELEDSIQQQDEKSSVLEESLRDLRNKASDFDGFKTYQEAKAQQLEESLRRQQRKSQELEECIRRQEHKHDALAKNERDQQVKSLKLEDSISRQSENISSHASCIDKLQSSIKILWELIESLRSYPKTITSQTKLTLEQSEEKFKQRYDQIHTEIMKVKERIAKMESHQAANKSKEFSASKPGGFVNTNRVRQGGILHTHSGAVRHNLTPQSNKNTSCIHQSGTKQNPKSQSILVQEGKVQTPSNKTAIHSNLLNERLTLKDSSNQIKNKPFNKGPNKTPPPSELLIATSAPTGGSLIRSSSRAASLFVGSTSATSNLGVLCVDSSSSTTPSLETQLTTPAISLSGAQLFSTTSTSLVIQPQAATLESGGSSRSSANIGFGTNPAPSFGQPATPNSSLYGATNPSSHAPGSLFGSTATNTLLGRLFVAQSSQPASLFGTQFGNDPIPTGSLFGGKQPGTSFGSDLEAQGNTIPSQSLFESTQQHEGTVKNPLFASNS